MGDRRQAERELADRVLSGRVDPADAPPELAPVAALVRRAASLPASEPIDDALVAAMASAVAESPQPHTTRRSRRPVLAQLLTAKVAAVALTATLGATSAAAATGNLPTPVQDKVASVAERVGVDLPDSASQRAKDVQKILAENPPGRERAKLLSQKPDAEAGTTADEKVTGKDRADEAKAQAEERKAAGQKRAADARTNAETEDDAEAEQTPPVSTPNRGGTTTADTASGGAAKTGTTKAAEQSDGASTRGSGNADVDREQD